MATVARAENGIEVPGCVVKEIEKQLYKTLKDVFRYDSYRSLVQKRAVEAVANGMQDVFVSMPTGAGKSLCYQLPAVVSERPGITIVVSPLIALMTNQISQMKSIGIPTETINSKMKVSERESVKADLMSPSPKTKLLYITPELASTTGFHLLMNHLYKSNNIARIVVDEAHCVSQWGHNFRPDYLRLGELRSKYMSVPWVALTATASSKVMDDVLLQLKLCHPIAIFKTSCFRPNLFYDIVFKETVSDPYEDLKDFAFNSLGDNWETTPQVKRGCGIIYCRTRDNCEEIAFKLTQLGLKTEPYHAGLKPKLRQETQSNWMEGRTPVIAATVSFGMGIDKPTVRFVAHWCVSQSLAGYYQESGRAGRDGQPSKCRIYYSKKDRDTILFLLKKDEKTAKSKLAQTKATASINSFNSVIKYCEELSCRHYLLSREFGDDIPDCKKHCDACCSPKAVQNKISLFHSMKFGSRIEKKGSACQDFSDLYGGGRKGQDDDTNAYYDSDSEDREKAAGKELSNLISKEFERRRGGGGGGKFKSKNDKYVIHNNKVLEPSLKKISGLSLEAREKFFDKLVEELKSHLKACSSNPQCPNLSEKDIKNCAAEYELTAVKTKSNVLVYRKDFMHVFKSLQEASRQIEIHPIIAKYMPKQTMQKKGSESHKEHLGSILNYVTRNKTDNKSCTNSQSCSDSHRTESTETSPTEYNSKMKARTLSSDSNDVERHKNIKYNNNEYNYSSKPSPQKSVSKGISESSKAAVENKPMMKYFFDSVTSHATGFVTKMSPDPNDSFLSPKSQASPHRKSSGSVQSSSGMKRSSSFTNSLPSPKKSKPTVTLKNNTTEKPKKEVTKTISQIQNDNLKKAADLVRKHLNPQYKANKISKDLFKIVCRSISHRLVEAGAVNDKAAKLEVEKLFQQYSILENASAIT